MAPTWSASPGAITTGWPFSASRIASGGGMRSVRSGFTTALVMTSPAPFSRKEAGSWRSAVWVWRKASNREGS